MSNKPEKNQTGKVNYIWVLAGGYLVYLAYKIFRTLMAGESNEPLLAIGAIVVFLAIGGFVLLREWRAYKFGLDHIDDPDTWGDDEEDEELAQLMESTKLEAAETEEEDPEEDEA